MEGAAIARERTVTATVVEAAFLKLDMVVKLQKDNVCDVFRRQRWNPWMTEKEISIAPCLNLRNYTEQPRSLCKPAQKMHRCLSMSCELAPLMAWAERNPQTLFRGGLSIRH
ncbi:MAG: hypothetical protein B0A82_24820 [Alkalinema sp. CACIAM 70d]|nr:MAG: hypothetical protein B0A82_24820 [Alkalinema sp. CACIAM 70d]